MYLLLFIKKYGFVCYLLPLLHILKYIKFYNCLLIQVYDKYYLFLIKCRLINNQYKTIYIKQMYFRYVKIDQKVKSEMFNVNYYKKKYLSIKK